MTMRAARPWDDEPWTAPLPRFSAPAQVAEHVDDETVDCVEPARAERRNDERYWHGSRQLDLPWVGPIPNIGQALWHPRRAAAGRTMGNHARRRSTRTPVRVDVVPIIHMRAARGRWSARWAAGCCVVLADAHRTFAPLTVVEAAAAAADELPASADEHTTSGRRGPPLAGQTYRRNVIRRPKKDEDPGATHSEALLSHFESRLTSHRTQTGAVRVPRYTAHSGAPH